MLNLQTSLTLVIALCLGFLGYSFGSRGERELRANLAKEKVATEAAIESRAHEIFNAWKTDYERTKNLHAGNNAIASRWVQRSVGKGKPTTAPAGTGGGVFRGILPAGRTDSAPTGRAAIEPAGSANSGGELAATRVGADGVREPERSNPSAVRGSAKDPIDEMTEALIKDAMK